MLKALSAGGRIPEDENVQELEMEWLTGQVAKEDFRAMERDDLLQDTQQAGG